MQRCEWCGSDPLYVKYHDEEWGVPVSDDKLLFEFLVLEGAQAGLSWLTILKKRENYRRAYDGFDPETVAKYSEGKIQQLLLCGGIVRNELKIRASVKNAQVFLEICGEFGSFARYVWGFVNGRPIVNTFKRASDLPSTSPLSDEISTDLKKRGMSFVGSTIIYAHMQATGMVNDHLTCCFRYAQLSNPRSVF